MTRVYYRDAAAAFVVFDLTRVATLEAAIKWKNDLDQKVLTADGNPVPTMLLGNKNDMKREPDMPTDEKITDFCKKNGFLGWELVSAKDGSGIEEAADVILQELVSREEHKGVERRGVGGIYHQLSTTPTAQPAKQGCKCS